MLAGCQPANTPDAVALAFWQALASDDLDAAGRFSIPQSSPLVKSAELPELKHASLKIGEIVINDQKATVETLVTSPQERVATVQTLLVKEGNHWKVDYQGTLDHLQHLPFNGFLKSLENMGGTVNEQLERGLQEFGEEFKKQVDEFGRELQKNFRLRPLSQVKVFKRGFWQAFIISHYTNLHARHPL